MVASSVFFALMAERVLSARTVPMLSSKKARLSASESRPASDAARAVSVRMESWLTV
jgi:hypothetical protein